MFSTVCHTTKRKNIESVRDVLPSAIWGIVLSYSHEYSRDILSFCEYFHLQKCIQELNEKWKKNAQECAILTQDLLNTKFQTTARINQTQHDIDISIATIKSQNEETVKKRIAEHKRMIDEQLSEKTKKDRSALEALNGKIAAQEYAAHELLEQKIHEEQQLAVRELQRQLSAAASESGIIGNLKKKQALAKKEFKDKRRELVQNFYAEEVLRTILLLEDLSKCMDDEIANKSYLSNLIQRCSLDVWDEKFWTTSNVYERIFKAVVVGSTFWVFFSLIGISVFTLPIVTLGIIALGIADLPAILIALAIGVGIGAILAGICLLCNVDNLLILDLDANRFEKHYLYSSFSYPLNEKFEETQQKITNFQKVNEVIALDVENDIMEKESQKHPLLKLNKKSAKVESIRNAVKTELTFFKGLYAQCTIDEEKPVLEPSYLDDLTLLD